jgi:hypothetical protein
MKTLYESILDDDLLDKTDKSVGMFLSIWDSLKKGLSRKYNALRVKHNIEDAIEKNDLLPHDDEWLQIVEQFNTNLNTKCVEEAPIEYKLRVWSSLISRSNRPFYSVLVDCYWRTYTKKNGEIIKRNGTSTVITSVMEFRYDPLDTKPRVIKAGLRAKSISDNKWVKRLSKLFNQTSEIDDKGNAVFVFR